jgi:hypothetical protein
MSLKIFESIISERLGNKEEADKEGLPVFDNAAEKVKLLALLPEELREKSFRENFPLEHIKKIVEFREQKGFKTVLGFHVSPREFKVGDNLQAGQDGEVYFSTKLETLYLGKGSGYIYALECSEKLMKPSDENLNWYTLKGKITILDKIKMTPEAVEALGAKFAECNYSG